MSVYIKGMEMPKSCGECPFFIENRHDRGDDSLCRASGKEAKCGCPLVPVPPHGRLIDADVLEKVMSEGIAPSVKDGGFKHPFDIIRAVANAPTIIPADQAEEVE